jgi:hypothetical protein
LSRACSGRPWRRVRRVTRQRGRRGGARRRPRGSSVTRSRSPSTRPAGFLGIWLRAPRSVQGAARDSNRARYAWPPQPWAGRCESANVSQRPRVTRWIRNANGFPGRCESANLSRLLLWRRFARGVANGAIFESAQSTRPNVERNPERRELLGVLHFWPNDAGMRGVVGNAGRSPSCVRRTRKASSR